MSKGCFSGFARHSQEVKWLFIAYSWMIDFSSMSDSLSLKYRYLGSNFGVYLAIHILKKLTVTSDFCALYDGAFSSPIFSSQRRQYLLLVFNTIAIFYRGTLKKGTPNELSLIWSTHFLNEVDNMPARIIIIAII